ncbi:hypothetical protein HK101_005503 [Irineochytrium annulatum]|nr:hypothetical protein HK101_005503 [Irineochytrium annulatum]
MEPLKRRRDESWDGGPVDEVAAPGARPSTSSPAVDNVGTLKVEGHPMRQVASPLTVPTSAPIKTALTELPKRLKKAPATEAAPLKRGKYHGRTRASKAEMEERSPEQAEPITLPSSISTVESSAASRQQRRTETVCCVTCDAELCQLIFHNSGKVDRDGSTPLCLRCNGSSDGARQCALCQADVFYIGDDDSMNFEEVEIVLETGTPAGTYAELQEVIDRHFKEFAAFFHQPQHKGTRVDRYLAVCYMKETRRKKGKAFPAATSQHPLIATTAAAAVNPTSSGSSTSTIVTTTSLSSAGSGSGLFDALPTATSHSQSDATAPTRQTMVACATLEWDLDRPHRVLAHHLILRIPTLQQGAIDGELICAMIERIEADWRRMRGGAAGRESVEEGAIDDEDERRPTRLLLAVPKVYQRWKAQATRLGFVGTAASGDVAGIEDLEWMGASFEDIKRNSAGKSKGKSKSKGKR